MQSNWNSVKDKAVKIDFYLVTANNKEENWAAFQFMQRWLGVLKWEWRSGYQRHQGSTEKLQRAGQCNLEIRPALSASWKLSS